MAFEQPQSRNEAILQNMLGAENELVPPQSRIEALLQAILLQGVPDGAVTTDKLADGAVTYDKLAEALKNLIDGKADKEGNWELIETITLEEEVKTIGRDYTISQNFTDCIVLIEFPQVTANITFNASIFTNTYYPCCNAYYSNGISASGNRYYQIHSNIINGYRRTTSRQGTRDNKDAMHGELVFDFSDLYLNPERYQKITQIFVNGVSGNLPIGTKVTILGNKEQ